VDEFGYLSVIISVILGLSIAQLLQGISQVINARDRVRMYWPTMAWTVLLLLVDIQAWWAMFGYRNRHAWTFVQFTIVLFEAIMLYLLAAIVLPNIPNEGEVDLRSNYFRHASWFFGSLVVLLLDSLLKSVVVSEVYRENPISRFICSGLRPPLLLRSCATSVITRHLSASVSLCSWHTSHCFFPPSADW
jgi:hypothetical protein